MKTRRWVMLLAGVGLVWGELLYYGVRTQFYRVAMVAAFLAVVVCATGALWRWKKWRWVPGGVVGAGILFLMLPGRAHDPAALRQAYVGRLKSYAGVRYVWGGEGWWGVDCSGFLRSAMVDALVMESVETMNPRLARDAAWLWWHDASAYDMGQGYGGITRQLGGKAGFPELGPGTPLEPGDFAVTADGSHVMAWLGEGKWIEADPTDMRVEAIVVEETKGWGLMKGVPSRWKWLER